MEEIKEFELAQVKAVRFKGWIGSLPESVFVNFDKVKKLAMGQWADRGIDAVLTGIESKQVGWVRVRLQGKQLIADGLLDYASPERLLLENGELGLDYEIILGGPNDTSLPLNDDGKVEPDTVSIHGLKLSRQQPGSTYALKQTEMSWEF